MNEEKGLCARWDDALKDLRGSLDLWERRLEREGAFQALETRRAWETFLADTAALQRRFEDLRTRDALLARELGQAIGDAVKLRLYWQRLARGFSRFGAEARVSVALEVLAQLQAGPGLDEAARTRGAALAGSLADRLSEALRRPEEELEAARRTRTKAERLLEERRRALEGLERDYQLKNQALRARLETLEAEKASLLGRGDAAQAQARAAAAEARAQAEREHALALVAAAEKLGRAEEQRRQALDRALQAKAAREDAERRAEQLARELDERARAALEAQGAAAAERARSQASLERLDAEARRLAAELETVNAQLAAEQANTRRLSAELEASRRPQPRPEPRS